MFKQLSNRVGRYEVLGLLSCCVLFSTLNAAASLIQPRLLARILDAGYDLSSVSKQSVLWLSIAVLATVITQSLLTICETRALAQFRAGLQAELLEKLSENTSDTSGRILQVFVEYTTIVTRYYVGMISKFLPGVAMFFIALIAMVRIDWVLTVVVIGLVLCIVVLASPLYKGMGRAEKDVLSQRNQLSDGLMQFLVSSETARFNGRLEHTQSRVAADIQGLYKAQNRSANWQAATAPVNNSLLPVLAVVVLGAASWRMALGQLSSVELVSYLMFLFILITPLLRVLSLLSKRAEALASWQEVVTLLTATKQQNLPNIVRDRVERYKEKLGKVEGLVVVTGESGIGKSTLLKAVAQETTPSYIAQTPALWGESARDMLELYAPASQMQKFEQFCLRFGLDLEDLEKPASALSGGERQRLALAAGIASGNSLIILDEPTSAISGKHQKAVVRAIHDFVDTGGQCLLCTHDQSFIEQLSPTRIIHMTASAAKS